MKKKVLIMAGYYIPSVKGGGPIQSIKNLVDNLHYEIDFYIIASDRDLGDDKPFVNIETNKWTKVGSANVYYVDKAQLTLKKMMKLINSIDYDVLYLNSFFSFKDSILPIILRKLGKLSNKSFVLAPRGQFSPGALGLKNKKKMLYINIVKKLGLYNDIIWHATAESEKEDIKKLFGDDSNIIIANNLTSNYKDLEFDKNLIKNVGELKIVFLSRVHPKKNLKKALEFMEQIKGKIVFNIYGPLEDKIYWSQCEDIINKLPSNITVKYSGLVKHDEVIEIFKKHHIFLFPTLGENFGHVISEALIGGCPVIISDQTPWRNLSEMNVGWDINLKDENRFVNIIQYCVNLNNNKYRMLSENAFNYGKEKSNQKDEIDNSLSLFK